MQSNPSNGDVTLVHCVDVSMQGTGGRIEQETPAGPVVMNLPPGLMDGQTLRLTGRGEIGPEGKRGDVLLTISFFSLSDTPSTPEGNDDASGYQPEEDDSEIKVAKVCVEDEAPAKIVTESPNPYPNIGKKPESAFLGWLFQGAGWVLYAVYAVLCKPHSGSDGMHHSLESMPFPATLVIVILASPLIFVAHRMITKGKAMCASAKAGRWLQHHDAKSVKGPFILYLRSFKKDGEKTGEDMDWYLNLPKNTVEEEFAKQLSKFGTMVAVGQPHETLPGDVGALRLYFGDDWQERVHELMQRAVAVVMVPGDTRAIVWETENAITHLPPHKFIISMDQAAKGDYQKYQDNTRHLFTKHPLPSVGFKLRFITFGPDWKPIPIERSYAGSFQRSGYDVRRDFGKALAAGAREGN